MVDLRLVASLALGAAVGAAHGNDGPRTPIAKLLQTGEVSCRPALPVFCDNIHVSCSGPSSIKTFSFRLRATRSGGSIDTASDAAGMVALYEGGRVAWDADDGYVILRPRQANGYIKMQADGTYSFRHYSAHAATMSRGHCE